MPILEYKLVGWKELERQFKQARKAGKLPLGTSVVRFIESQWNELGAAGWELVTCTTTTGLGITVDATYYWKRALPTGTT